MTVYLTKEQEKELLEASKKFVKELSTMTSEEIIEKIKRTEFKKSTLDAEDFLKIIKK